MGFALKGNQVWVAAMVADALFKTEIDCVCPLDTFGLSVSSLKTLT